MFPTRPISAWKPGPERVSDSLKVTGQSRASGGEWAGVAWGAPAGTSCPAMRGQADPSLTRSAPPLQVQSPGPHARPGASA